MFARMAWLWLAAKDGIGPHAVAQLLESFGSPEQIFAADRELLTRRTQLRKMQIDVLCDKSTDRAEKILENCEKQRIQIITQTDTAYPDRLRNIADPPIVLYVRGNLPDFDAAPGIAVVGTRKSTPYGESVAEGIGRGLASAGFLTVSGMAKGNDGAALRGALRGGGRAVAVLAGGVDICYPLSNQALMGDILLGGALVSEQPPGTEHRGELFPPRNRIISGLCVATVVVEAPNRRSGALITAHHALDQGRDVYAVPGAIGAPASAACNALIESGEAALLTGPDALVRAYCGLLREKPNEMQVRQAFLRQTGIRQQPAVKTAWEDVQQREEKTPAASRPPKAEPAKSGKLPPDLNEEELQLCTLIQNGCTAPSELLDHCELPAARVMATLTMLEMDGLVIRVDGQLRIK